MRRKSIQEGKRWSGASVARRFLKWIAVVITSSFVVAIFQDAVIACSEAVRNTSTGLVAKFIDTYYIRAAQSEITDCATQSAIFASMTLIMAYGFLSGYFARRLRGFQDALQQMTQQHNKKKKKTPHDEYLTNYKSSIIFCKGVIVIAVLFCLAYVYVISLNVISYGLLRNYNHTMRVVGNVVDKDKKLEIDGMWVRMRSKSDYVQIRQKLDALVAASNNAWSNRMVVAEGLQDRADR